MILLDTNVIIDAHYGAGNYRVRARELISSAVIDTGAAINCITLGELYAGPRGGEEIEEDMRRAGIFPVRADRLGSLLDASDKMPKIRPARLVLQCFPPAKFSAFLSSMAMSMKRSL